MHKIPDCYVKGYPRPQFVRKNWLDLCGRWDFLFDDENIGMKKGYYRAFPAEHLTITVPFSYETVKSGIGDQTVHKVVWYNRAFTAEPLTGGQRYLIHFEGSDYATKVWVNGHMVGTHEGGYCRFSVDATDYLSDRGENILTVRYALLPYLYSEFMKCALTGGSMFRPMAFDYPDDPTCLRIEDQVMLGSECMIAPVYECNARGRYVYLPEDMLMVRFRSAEDYDLIPMEKGRHWIDLDLHEMPLFIRKGCVIPMSRGGEWVEQVDATHLTLLGWVRAASFYKMYNDDGYTTKPVLEDGMVTITCEVKDGKVVATGDGVSVDGGKVVVK